MNVNQIESDAKTLADASKMSWGRNMRKLSELIMDSDKGKKVATDYFFEFWCFIKAAVQLRSVVDNSTWVLCGPRTNRSVWPLKPGDPDHFSHYQFKHASFEYRLHPGVNATPHRFTGTYAPDISVRRTNGSGSSGRVVAMWDAKYRKNDKSPLTRPEVLTFISERELLVKRDATDNAFISSMKKSANEAFHVCGLLTNGRFSSEDKAYLREKSVQEVMSFGTVDQDEKP